MMTRESWLIVALAVLAALGGGWLQHRAQARHDGSRLLGGPVPAQVLRDLDGRPHALSDYAGRRVLLNLWAPWCGPCRQEMPALAEAQRRYGHGRPVVVGIAMDEPAAVRAYLAAHPVGYPNLLGRLAPSPDSAQQLGDAAGILPYSVLLDPDGTVRAVHRGRLDAATLAEWLGPAG